MTDWGFAGSAGNFSMITFLGGASLEFWPEIVTTLRGICTGISGGASRIIKGSGVVAFLGLWRITIGGAGGGSLLAICLKLV